MAKIQSNDRFGLKLRIRYSWHGFHGFTLLYFGLAELKVEPAAPSVPRLYFGA